MRLAKKIPGSPLLPKNAVPKIQTLKRNISNQKMTITFNTIQRSSPLPKIE
jgi:hypothetical protein